MPVFSVFQTILRSFLGHLLLSVGKKSLEQKREDTEQREED